MIVQNIAYQAYALHNYVIIVQTVWQCII